MTHDPRPTTASTIPPTGRVLGLDWGTSRIGVAITDETQLICTPLDVLSRRAGKRLPVRQFLTLVEREHPVGLVVGIPYADEGREGMSATAAREMGIAFAERSGLPLQWIDESFSTTDSLQLKRDAGPSLREQRVDALAAAMLLDRWLSTRQRG